ncbi:MAG: hypothetical protein ACXVW2_07985 [Nocardioidaceae bacterium]
MNGYIHAPTPRRPRTATPVDLLLIKLIRSAIAEDWTPANAVPGLLTDAAGHHQLLRAARTQLLRTFRTHPSRAGGRALAALTLALAETRTFSGSARAAS